MFDFEFRRLSNIDTDLSATTVEMAEVMYRKDYGVPPSTILVPPELTVMAYEILATVASVTKMAIVPVPGMPSDSWAVGGSCGFFWSPGA